MRTHTSDYKNNVFKFGRELDSKITYTLNNEEIELGVEDLNSITPHYEGAILKSVMRQLDIDSNVDIPIGTILNYQFGVKVDEDENGNIYEYINFNNYIVYSSEKQEDTNSYKIICYDKMLYSMVDYETMNITYPITIRNYINAICTKLGLTFKNANDIFANYDKQIQMELYLDAGGNSLNYKFRDVLDELAQVTASTICINEDDDELEIRYITNTNDTINEEYLKNINVNFGEKFGPVNSIVLSRSAESDNVYIKDDESIAQNGLCELKIIDNQIMNFNNRSDYLPDLLSKLGGLEYYLNDYSSTGITYYDLCDRYNVQIGETSYSCVMFNDEINVTQGLEENTHTDMPEETQTDYSKADKTDRKINQTYLIVDKQNNAIEGMSSQITEQNEQIAIIRLQYNELLSRISDIADITTSGESSYASVNLIDVNASQPISIKIHPIAENISYLYPRNNLYPSSTLYMKSRKLRFTNTTTNEVFDWKLPTDLWYYDSTTYDELELSYGDGTNSNVIVTRKCQVNADGTTSVLSTPSTETYPYPSDILLTDGNYTISLLGYEIGYLYVQLMAKNIYTTQFYTKAEVNTLIDQTAQEITLEADAQFTTLQGEIDQNTSRIVVNANGINTLSSSKVGNDEVISRINQSPEQISINANKLNLSANDVFDIISGNTLNLTSKEIQISSNNFSVDKNGNITSVSGNIGGWNITSSALTKQVGNYVFEIRTDRASNEPTLLVWDTANNRYNWYVRPDGYMYARNCDISGTVNASSGSFSGSLYSSYGTIGGFSLGNQHLRRTSSNGNVGIGTDIYGNTPALYVESANGDNWSVITPYTIATSGSKNRIVNIEDNKQVLLYAYETATPYFGDIGSGKTDENGYCKIYIEEIFSQTIEIDDYKVFIQECGDGHLFVKKYKNYFEVKGTPNLEFDWEIKSIQKDYKNVRLQEFNKKEE